MAKPHRVHHSAKLIKKRGKKVGAAPGTLIHVGETKNTDINIRLIAYNETTLKEFQLSDPAQCHPPQASDITSWFNIDGLNNPDIIREIGDRFELHPLIQEDILNTDHRPKIEVHDKHLYIVIKMLQFNGQAHDIEFEQISLVVGDDYVLSFQEKPGDVFDGVRERLRSGRRIRRLGPDYLAYALIDALVDNYFLILEKLGDAIEDLEFELLDKPSKDTVNRIHHFKREMLLLRKAIWPLREVLSSLSRDESVILSDEIRMFLRDVYDHTIHIIDNIETLRDLLAGLLDLYVSSVSQRMNEVMKVLTMFASIFMPLTFIAGIYGMNFENMPELQWQWGYPAALFFMALCSGGLLLYFKWRRWW